MLTNYTRVLYAILSECRNWPTIIYAKIFDKIIDKIILRNNFTIYVNGIIGKADLSMFSEIFYKKYYNPKGFEIREHDIVFDIGANSGFFTFYASQQATYGKIYSFEPLPSLVEKIERTLMLNNIRNVHVENMAVGKFSTENVSFYVSKEHNGCHSLYEREGEVEKISVTTITLQTYCANNNISKIDFLKLDCEGAEYDILTTESIEFIKKIVYKISMEYHDNINNHTHKEIVELLSTHGFTTTVKDGYLYALNNNLKHG